jgi:glycosyltransferase involved in cell wall biosynthesis
MSHPPGLSRHWPGSVAADAQQMGEGAPLPARLTCCAIIPAYCEAGRIGAVVRVAVGSGLFTRVLVVDDGSPDATAAEARAAGAEVLRHNVNQGKPAALRTGLTATAEPALCFLDADLTGLALEHLRALIEPVANGAVPATLGVFRGGRLATTLAQRIAPLISGQRCVRRALLDNFTDWGSGYGIETALNAHLLAQGVQQRIVEWRGAGQVMKEEKWGLWRGIAWRARMYWQILRAWLRLKLRRPGRGSAAG